MSNLKPRWPGYGQPFVSDYGPMPGYVAGYCGHRVAESEWRAGFRVCERCNENDYSEEEAVL